MYRYFRRPIRSLLISCLLFSLSSAHATPVVISREAAVARALEHNTSLQAAKQWVAQAEGRLIQAGRLDNPELKLNYATDRTFNDEGEYAYGVGFEQRFPVTNRLRLEKEIAADELKLSRFEVMNQERILAHEVDTLALRVVELDAQLALREELLDLYADFMKFIEARFQTGEASVLEVNQIKIERYSISQEQLRIENDLGVAAAQLSELLGYDPEQVIQLNYVLKLPVKRLELPPYTREFLDVHPMYQMHEQLMELADGAVDLAKANRWADIAVEVFYEEERGVDFPDGLGRDRFFGVGLSIPLPLLNDRRGEVQERRALRAQRQYELHNVAREIHADVRLGRVQVEKYDEQARAYESGIQQLVVQNLETLQHAYASGQIGLAELFQSQSQGYKVRSTQLAILHDYEQAVADWEFAAAKQKGLVK